MLCSYSCEPSVHDATDASDRDDAVQPQAAPDRMKDAGGKGNDGRADAGTPTSSAGSDGSSAAGSGGDMAAAGAGGDEYSEPRSIVTSKRRVPRSGMDGPGETS